jgi:hypothetical protein
MEETWKPVVGYEGYEVSDQGNVRSWRIKGNTKKPVTTPRLLKAWKHGHGRKYCAVKLSKDNKGHTISVHRIVLEAFVGPMPEGQECRHLNGNPEDNRLENLAYGTHLENMDDLRRHGTHARLHGVEHGCAKLTEQDVLEIRALYADKKYNQYELASMYGIDQTNVSLIVRRKKWKHI